LFRHRSFGLGTLVALLYFGGFTEIFFIFTLFVQRGLGYSVPAAGIAIAPFAVGAGSAAALGDQIVNRVGRPLVAFGLSLVAASLGATITVLHFVPGQHAPFATASPLLFAGLGSGARHHPQPNPHPRRGTDTRGRQRRLHPCKPPSASAPPWSSRVGSLFFARLGAGPDHWASAFRTALLVAIGFVLVGLIAATADIRHAQERAGRPASALIRLTDPAAVLVPPHSGLLGIGMARRTGAAPSGPRRTTGHARPVVLDHDVDVVGKDRRSPAHLDLALRRRNFAFVLTSFLADRLFSGTRVVTHRHSFHTLASESLLCPDLDQANDRAQANEAATRPDSGLWCRGCKARCHCSAHRVITTCPLVWVLLPATTAGPDGSAYTLAVNPALPNNVRTSSIRNGRTRGRHGRAAHVSRQWMWRQAIIVPYSITLSCGSGPVWS
jgi:hypothetical protein